MESKIVKVLSHSEEKFCSSFQMGETVFPALRSPERLRVLCEDGIIRKWDADSREWTNES